MSGFITADKVALMLGVVKQGRPRRLADEVAVNHVILPKQSFDHHLGTATFYPVFATNFNATIWLKSKDTTSFTVGFNVQPKPSNTLTYRLSIVGGEVAVPAGSSGIQITHNLNDDTAALFFTPDWNTNVWVTIKAANSTFIAFSTHPTKTQRIYYGKFDLDTSAIDTISIPANASRHIHTHGLGHVMADIFATPTWNTTTYLQDSLRTENEATLRFSTQAPSGKTLDVAAGVPLIGELL